MTEEDLRGLSVPSSGKNCVDVITRSCSLFALLLINHTLILCNVLDDNLDLNFRINLYN